MFKLTSISLVALLLFAGVFAFVPAVHAQTNEDADSVVSSTNYTGTMTYTGQLYTRGGSPVDTSNLEEGTYYTAAGSPIYYIKGWFYYPITSAVPTGTVTGPGTTVVTPGAPNTGSSGTGSTGVLTPGAPNTGAGGLSGTMWLALVLSALVAMGGLSYVTRRVAER
jgi:hypothetical protein